VVAIIFFFVCLFNFLLFTGVNFYAQVKICIDDKRTVDRRVHFFLLRHEIYSCLTLESLKFARNAPRHWAANMIKNPWKLPWIPLTPMFENVTAGLYVPWNTAADAIRANPVRTASWPFAAHKKNIVPTASRMNAPWSKSLLGAAPAERPTVPANWFAAAAPARA